MPGAEHETKLTPPAGFRLPDLSDAGCGVIAGPVETRELDATYYDTGDLRLVRAGASLRWRDDEGWIVKLPSTGARPSATLHRTEHAFDGPRGEPPAAAVDLVRALLRTAPVEPVAELHTRRTSTELRDPDGGRLGVLVDDEVTARTGSTDHRFRELEVEVAPSARPRVAEVLVERLRRAGASVAPPIPKVARALGPRATAPADVVTPTTLDPEVPAGDVIRAAISASVLRLLAHDPGVRLGGDPEDVHQARVATRRLRSDLRTFRALLDDTWVRDLRAELRWLGGELGAVRDAEVLLDRLRERADVLALADQAGATHLLGRLVNRWEAARSELLGAVRSLRYLELLERLVAAARAPALRPEAATRAVEVLPPLVRAPWTHLRTAVSALGADPRDEALHEVRIRAKRCRYAAEAVAPALGKSARAFAKAMAGVQEVLGEHQDAVVAEQWLREEARRGAPPDELFVAGELAGLERVAALAARDRWQATWRAAARKRLRAWL